MVKRNSLFLLIPLLCGALPMVLTGQEAAPAPKLPPLPRDFALEKKYSYRQEKPKDGATEEALAAARFLDQFPKPVEVDLVQTGSVRKEIVRMTDGSKWEKWKSGAMRFATTESAPDHIAVSAPGMDLYEVRESGDFEELSWFRDAKPAGEQTKNGRPCFVYRAGDNVVWMDQSVGLPVLFESPTLVVTYKFKAPPSEALQLPEKFKKRMEEVTKAWSGRAQ